MLQRIAWNALIAAKNYRINAKDLKTLQDKKVRRLIRYCYNTVPYYHQLMRENGLRPEDITGSADLDRIPKLTRQTIQANYPQRILARGAKTGLSYMTSGTTGAPLRVHWGTEFCDIHLGITTRKGWVHGVRPWQRAAVITTGPDFEFGSEDTRMSTRASRAYRVLFGSFNTTFPIYKQQRLSFGRGNIKVLADFLKVFKPDIIHGRPAQIRRLGEFLSGEGRQLSVEKVMCNAEYMSDSVRKDIQELYRAEVFESYGSREFGGMAFECPEHSGLHINADYLIFEILRKGERVSPGEAGDVLITGLHNEAMPFLRYEQGDVLVMGEDGKCNCGSYLPRLRAVYGRLNDGLISADGEIISPGAVCHELESVFGMRDFQLIQKGRNRLILKLREKDNSPVKLELVKSRLKALLLDDDLTVDVEIWSQDDIPPKYRPVISEILGQSESRAPMVEH